MELLVLPVLGRPFTLGALYNANKNQIIPSVSVSRHEQTDIKVTRNVTYSNNLTTTDSLESKMKSLGIRGNLAISAIANTVELKGSGSYLSDTKTSKRQARVVLESSGTTRQETLSLNCFSKEKIDNCLKMINILGATHVAVEITYGHQLFLQLETTCDSEEKKEEVEGAIKMKLSSWVPVQFEEDLSGRGPSECLKELKELHVKVHGTVELKKNPVSLKEAIHIFKIIPDLVKDKDSPMTVCLLPLAAMHSSVPNVCCQIKDDILITMTSVFEDINSSIVSLNGIESSGIATRELRIRRNAKELKTMLNSYKHRLQINLADILGDPKMEITSEILKVFKKHDKSPYSANILGVYILKMEKEVKFMTDLVNILSCSQNDRSSSDESNHGEAGRKKFTIDIHSDEIYVPIPLCSSDVIVLELPIVTENNNLHKAMKSYDTNNDEGWAHFMAEPLTLPFEDKSMQRKIREYANMLVDLAAGKCTTIFHHTRVIFDPAAYTFTCVFKGYKDKTSIPSLAMYRALGSKRVFYVKGETIYTDI